MTASSLQEALRSAVLALIQGLTEFLPVSSSAHLLLPSQLLGWPDQGLAFDAALHGGTLLAVLAYFSRDLRALGAGVAQAMAEGRLNPQARLLLHLAIATVPAGLAGFLLRDLVAAQLRNLPVIAAATVFFALLLGWADLARGRLSFPRLLFSKPGESRERGRQRRNLLDSRLRGNDGHPQSAGADAIGVNLRSALLIGIAQAFAIIPGASRSGVAMTAALFCGLNREAAARFAFLLSIPIIAAAALLETATLFQQGGRSAAPPDWLMLIFAAALAALAAFLTIHFFLRLVARLGFMPFVIYRILLGGALFLFYLGSG